MEEPTSAHLCPSLTFVPDPGDTARQAQRLFDQLDEAANQVLAQRLTQDLYTYERVAREHVYDMYIYARIGERWD
eukprot:88021-Amorphochlora_amoeboformis.AAC.2